MARQGDPNTPADDSPRRRTSAPNEEPGTEGGRGNRSKWQERTAPAADDPVSEDELKGLSILGGSSIRDGAIPGVSDPVRDGRAGPHERADDLAMEEPDDQDDR